MHEVLAYNTATRSENAMHHDDVAQRYGFRGGLVPGVDVYAYLTRPAAERWGLEWLARGRMQGRFVQPVYDGETVTVHDTEQPDGSLLLEVRNAAGGVCATGAASLPMSAPDVPEATRWPRVDEPAPDDRPAPTPASLAAGTALGLAPHTFDADRAPEYLHDVREALPVYADERVAHPAWLLRDANYVLSRSVRLGPWIHVSSDAQHHGLVRHGEAVSARAIVVDEWERKGHRFVELDVLLLAGDRPVTRVTHTAIHTPRSSA